MRHDGYVRASQLRGRGGESLISPAVQRERIEAWAAAYGHHLAIVHEQLDESGARADRRRLLEAIERLEARETSGIIVAKLDRFARTLIDGLRLIERSRDAGGTFGAVADGLQISTDTGRLVVRPKTGGQAIPPAARTTHLKAPPTRSRPDKPAAAATRRSSLTSLPITERPHAHAP